MTNAALHAKLFGTALADLINDSVAVVFRAVWVENPNWKWQTIPGHWELDEDAEQSEDNPPAWVPSRRVEVSTHDVIVWEPVPELEQPVKVKAVCCGLTVPVANIGKVQFVRSSDRAMLMEFFILPEMVTLGPGDNISVSYAQ